MQDNGDKATPSVGVLMPNIEKYQYRVENWISLQRRRREILEF